MKLVLENLRPEHIIPSATSGVWGQDVRIEKGEHLHIIAPSGSGKSSLMHFIYGLRNDFDGRILLAGEDLKLATAERKAILRQQHFSIIFQDLRLFPDLSAMENIRIKQQLRPYHSEDEIVEMAEMLGVSHKLSQLTRTCSYGEQQRIAIIRALMQPFDFLLLDEPYSHLDEPNRRKAMELIYRECARRGAAMIFADLRKLEFFENEKSIYL